MVESKHSLSYRSLYILSASLWGVSWNRKMSSLMSVKSREKYCPKVDKMDRRKQHTMRNKLVSWANKQKVFLHFLLARSSLATIYILARAEALRENHYTRRGKRLRECLASVYKTRKKCVKIFSLISEIRLIERRTRFSFEEKISFFSYCRALESIGVQLNSARESHSSKQSRAPERKPVNRIIWVRRGDLETPVEDFTDYKLHEKTSGANENNFSTNHRSAMPSQNVLITKSLRSLIAQPNFHHQLQINLFNHRRGNHSGFLRDSECFGHKLVSFRSIRRNRPILRAAKCSIIKSRSGYSAVSGWKRQTERDSYTI